MIAAVRGKVSLIVTFPLFSFIPEEHEQQRHWMQNVPRSADTDTASDVL
jgi:hypothetical protein